MSKSVTRIIVPAFASLLVLGIVFVLSQQVAGHQYVKTERELIARERLLAALGEVQDSFAEMVGASEAYLHLQDPGPVKKFEVAQQTLSAKLNSASAIIAEGQFAEKLDDLKGAVETSVTQIASVKLMADRTASDRQAKQRAFEEAARRETEVHHQVLAAERLQRDHVHDLSMELLTDMRLIKITSSIASALAFVCLGWAIIFAVELRKSSRSDGAGSSSAGTMAQAASTGAGTKDDTVRLLKTELERLKQRLATLSQFDPETETMNSSGLEPVLGAEQERAFRSKEQLAVMLINCDHFKTLNETVGKSRADMALRNLAIIIRSCLRPIDHLARVGGDDFLVLLCDSAALPVMRVAEQIRKTVEEELMQVDGRTFRITVSIGVANLPSSVKTIDNVLQCVQPSMKKSKELGRNRVTLAREGGQIEEPISVDEAVSWLKNDSSFRTVFQPIMDLATGMPVGYELYSRGPAGKFESPAVFFQLCIDNNLLNRVDLACLRQAIASTNSVKRPMRLFVNLFPSTIFETPIDELLSLFPLDDPNRTFCIEISEQHIAGAPGYLKDHTAALRARGIRIAIDDVGFGRSSLETLILLEPDVVKVDRKYVTGLSDDPSKVRLLKKVANVGKSLGAEIVAEGIEDAKDVPLLREIGIQFGQGFLWGNLLDQIPS